MSISKRRVEFEPIIDSELACCRDLGKSLLLAPTSNLGEPAILVLTKVKLHVSEPYKMQSHLVAS